MTTKDFQERCTPEQQEAMRELQKRSGIPWEEFLKRAIPPTKIFNYVGIPDFHGMFVGIEEDGHTHT